jgi:hypothetical protein
MRGGKESMTVLIVLALVSVLQVVMSVRHYRIYESLEARRTGNEGMFLIATAFIMNSASLGWLAMLRMDTGFFPILFTVGLGVIGPVVLLVIGARDLFRVAPTLEWKYQYQKRQHPSLGNL